jgi:phosphoglycerate dehydrogenase-like enzyme
MSLDVLCLRPSADFERADARAPASLQVTYRAPDDQDVVALMKQARALLIPAVGPKLSDSLFNDSTVRLLQVTGAGLDRVNIALLKNLGILLANVPGGSNAAIAEYAVTSASSLLRQFARASSEIKAGNYARIRSQMLGRNLSGLDSLRVGVIGLGIIGFAVAKAFHDRGCHIAFFDPAPRDLSQAAAIGAKSLSFDEVLEISDIVTLHVPLLASTLGLVGARELALMKPGAILIHASRGGIVDESALAACLASGHLGGAAVDVFSNEPPETGNPLLMLDGDAAHRLLLTPHIAGVTRQAATFLFRSAWQNLERFLIAGEPPQNCCD